MTIRAIVSAAAIVAAGIVPNAAFAAVFATATADLNIRSGPGPEYPVVGAIPTNGQPTIIGCIQGSLWCQVTYNGRQGWAYSRYLATELPEIPVVVAEPRAEIGIPTVAYETTGTAPSAAEGAADGAVIGGPIGAAIGAVAGATAGAGVAIASNLAPPQEVRTYVIGNPAQPVYLDGDVVVGAGLPEEVELLPIPDYQYRYVYVNRQPVLVDPASRRIVYVYR